MTPEWIRLLAVALTAATLVLGAAAFWLYRRERRNARGFRHRVQERLKRVANRRG